MPPSIDRLLNLITKETNKKEITAERNGNFYGALIATFVEKSVWMRSQSHEWWDCDVMRFYNFVINHFQSLFTSGFTTSGFFW